MDENTKEHVQEEVTGIISRGNESGIIDQEAKSSKVTEKPDLPVTAEAAETTDVITEESQGTSLINDEHFHVDYKPCLFRNPVEKNVIFCLDTSGSMYEVFETVKKHIVRVLLRKADKSKANETAFFFNLIQL